MPPASDEWQAANRLVLAVLGMIASPDDPHPLRGASDPRVNDLVRIILEAQTGGFSFLPKKERKGVKDNPCVGRSAFGVRNSRPTTGADKAKVSGVTHNFQRWLSLRQKGATIQNRVLNGFSSFCKKQECLDKIISQLRELFGLDVVRLRAGTSHVEELQRELEERGSSLRNVPTSRDHGSSRSSADQPYSIQHLSTFAAEAQPLITQALNMYYPREDLQKVGLTPYSIDVEGVPLTPAIATKPEWIGLTCKVGRGVEYWDLDYGPAPYRELLPQWVDRPKKIRESMKPRNWNNDCYRLLDFTPGNGSLIGRLGISRYLPWLDSEGLLGLELLDAILQHDVKNVLEDQSDKLPLRRALLPDAGALMNLNARNCVGGVVACLAVADPDTNGFIVHYQKRSALVSQNAGLLSMIPEGLHQPLQCRSSQTDLGNTFWREFAEELCGKEELERNPKRLDVMRAVYRQESIHWLRQHPESYRLECTAAGLGLTVGSYHLTILLAIDNAEFWNVFRNGKTGWESEWVEFVPSTEPEEITKLLRKPDWTPEGVFALSEGLLRLRKLYPDRVRLPKMERAMPKTP